MSEEKIRVKCPVCSGILKVKYSSGLESKSLKCPICGSVSKFANYQRLSQVMPQSDETDYRRGDERIADSPGILIDAVSGKKYQLAMGSNMVGRKATTSSAHIQIETDDLYMSRNHAEIQVKKSDTGRYLYYFQNARNKNASYVNGQLVKDGDCLILEGGETIRMGHTEFRFETGGKKSSLISSNQGETEY